MNITIIGVGLIGGSVALGLKGFQTHIIGVDANPKHVQTALKLGIIDEANDLDTAVSKSDLIIMAIPVDAARKLLPYILNHMPANCTLTDMGSTKSGICQVAAEHPRRGAYVAAHPMAGTENSGPEAAIHGLFTHKKTVICERELSHSDSLDVVLKMYEILQMNILYMSPEDHDRHIAYVSHISHISSFTLGLTVLEIEKDEERIFDMASTGFASTVRLAKSSPDMWAPIFKQNAPQLSTALDAYIKNLQLFKELIEEGNIDEIRKLMTQANDIRRILDGIRQ
ncbi:MAG: hypothetical protein RIS47_1148 [Bacteroidota bacterium]|jgi:prephenate dehydrogenase